MMSLDKRKDHVSAPDPIHVPTPSIATATSHSKLSYAHNPPPKRRWGRVPYRKVEIDSCQTPEHQAPLAATLAGFTVGGSIGSGDPAPPLGSHAST